MHIHSMPSSQAYSRQPSSVDVSQRTPADTSETTKAGGTTSGPATESPTIPKNTTGSSEKPESGSKLTPAGLLAAQLRFQSMNSEDMNKGQARAFEVISRNIERYQTQHGITTTPVTGTPDGTEPITVTQLPTDTDLTDGAGTTSTSPPIAGTEPTTGEVDATLPTDQATAT
ncbi:MAG TPA: hypothetical protein VF096_06240 [Azonexus sp.]